MDRETVFEKVKEIVVAHLGMDEEAVTVGASFTEDLGADSLDVVEIIMAVEEEFGIEVDDREAETVATVGEAVDKIHALVGRPS